MSISTTSSRFTIPSLSRSKIWKPSLISLTCAGGSFASASPPSAVRFIDASLLAKGVELRVGEVDGAKYDSRFVNEGVKFRTVLLSSSPSSPSSSIVGVVTVWSFEGDCNGVCGFVGEVVVGVVGRAAAVDVGVEGRTKEVGEEGEGDSGRRKGEVRGEPKERGEGL